MSERISGGVVTASKKHKPTNKELAAMATTKPKRLGRQERRALRKRITRALKRWGQEANDVLTKKQRRAIEKRVKARRGGAVGKRVLTRAERKERARAWKAAGRPH